MGVVVVDPRGHPTTYRFSSAGELVGVTDALGHTTTSTRDPATNLVQSVTDPLNRTTQFTYDAAGNVLTATRLAGTPDAVTTTYTYEATFNRVTSIRDPLNHTTSFGYDTHGNLTSVTDPLTNRTTIAYNATGDPTSVTDPLTNVTTLTYDVAGNLVTIADPLGHTTTRTYDAVSRLLSQTNPLGFTTKLTYDALNRVTAIRDPKNGLTQFGYDPNGNLLTLTDALSHTTGYTYDAMDRVATRTDPLGHSESFTYDLAGNLAQHLDRKGQGATFTYDALNRRTGATYVDATVTYTYDAVGRLTEASDAVGGTITNAWDGLDRLTTAQGTVGYTYDAAGRRTRMTVPGQTAIDYDYDNANRLTTITQGTSVVQFAYDVASRRTRLTLPNGVTTEYGYDAASQLTSLTYKLGTTVLGDVQYTYDAGGQRIQVGGSWARTGLPAALTAATYNANNQQVTFGGQTLTYDLNGNLTSDGTNNYTWEARDRLIALTGPVPASFVYDPAGRRARKTINGTATDVLYDGLNPVQEAAGTAVISVLPGLGIDEYFIRADASGASTFLTDALGSTVALADSSGATQTEYTYEPFGATTATVPTANAFDYTGRESDATGLKYYRARYYHPTLQRFLGEDPLEFAAGDANLYGYVRNAPIDGTDPTGEVLLAGCLGGAALSLAEDAGSYLLSGRKLTVGGVIGDALLGCASGAIGAKGFQIGGRLLAKVVSRGALFSRIGTGPRASAELLEAIRKHGRTIKIATEGSEELRYLNVMGAEANVGGPGHVHIILRENPSKAAALEEFLHGTQSRLGIIDRLGVQGAEAHVTSFMQRHMRMLGLQ